MALMLSNATILEGEELQPVKGFLEIKSGRITRICEGSPPKRGVNLKGAILMPPFVNAHTHLADSAWKERYLGKTQAEVVGPQGIKHKMLRGAKTKVLEAMRSSLAEMLATGTLAHCDFREGGTEGVRLLQKSKMPPVTTKILGRGNNLRELGRVLSMADGIGLSSLDSVGEEELRRICRRIKREKKLFSVHVDETTEEHRHSLEEYGESELKRALKLDPSFLVHATHADAEDLSLVKRHNVPVVFCPRCNSLLGSGSPPIALAMELGVEFWIGTDNGMVCEPNMFEELRSAWQCVRRQNPRAGPEEAVALLPLPCFRQLH